MYHHMTTASEKGKDGQLSKHDAELEAHRSVWVDGGFSWMSPCDFRWHFFFGGAAKLPGQLLGG